ncbi:DUF6010 family protein [Micromonospora sp. NPDC049559]|uniref:DUF6010 family protein n=1 Tax=Micromonospora sp. NPDC049559 TaxID=3155923 RepID=UPI00341D1314
MLVLSALLIGLGYVLLVSLLREPARRRFNAIMVAGAGAAYLSGGALGPWEFAFTAAVTYCAYRGLDSYAWTGVGWLLHTGWDLVHHLKGAPIVPFDAHSSLGCAICDPVIAIWCLCGGPSLPALVRSRFSRRSGGAPRATGRDGAGRILPRCTPTTTRPHSTTC